MKGFSICSKLIPLCRMAVAAMLLAVALVYTPTTAVAEPPLPRLQGEVTDLTSTLTREEKEAMIGDLRRINERGSQVAVLVVPTIQGEAIESYSKRVVDEWKLGRVKHNDGVLLLVVLHDRLVRIEVGTGLERAITNARAKQIIDEIMVPHFRQQQIAPAIRSGIDAIGKLIPNLDAALSKCSPEGSDENQKSKRQDDGFKCKYPDQIQR